MRHSPGPIGPQDFWHWLILGAQVFSHSLLRRSPSQPFASPFILTFVRHLSSIVTHRLRHCLFDATRVNRGETSPPIDSGAKGAASAGAEIAATPSAPIMAILKFLRMFFSRSVYLLFLWQWSIQTTSADFNCLVFFWAIKSVGTVNNNELRVVTSFLA